LAYAYWLRETSPEVSIFWVYASSTERFRQAYTRIAEECQIPGYRDRNTDILLLVKTWLETKYRNPWLMILDNADDMDMISNLSNLSNKSLIHGQQRGLNSYIPECAHGSVLITTRNKKIGVRLTKGESPVEIEKMDDGESEELLRVRLVKEGVDTQDLSALSALLEHLPLALVQAAAFIQENSMQVKKYVQLLLNYDPVIFLGEEFETIGRDSELPSAVSAVWIASFEQVRKQNVFASDLLSFMSLLDRQDIPLELVSWFAEQQDSQSKDNTSCLQRALGILKAFCFITATTDQSLDMHRLVHLVTRSWVTRQDRKQWFASQAILGISEHFPYYTYENSEVCSYYIPHVYSVLNHEAVDSMEVNLARPQVIHRLAAYCLYQGQWLESEQFVSEALTLRTTILGSDHPDTLSSMNNLASTYWNQGRWDEAEKLHIQVLEMGKVKLGSDHPNTLTSMNNLAYTWHCKGQYSEAIELMKACAQSGSKVLGDTHPYTLSSLATIASWSQ
jgi:tetratricopeptide (TPR) repeat protein